MYAFLIHSQSFPIIIIFLYLDIKRIVQPLFIIGTESFKYHLLNWIIFYIGYCIIFFFLVHSFRTLRETFFCFVFVLPPPLSFPPSPHFFLFYFFLFSTMSHMGFYEQGDNITWRKGQQFDDGSNILMVERIEERAIDVSVCQARCALCCLAFYPCIWCCACPPLCYARTNMEVRESIFLFCF